MLPKGLGERGARRKTEFSGAEQLNVAQDELSKEEAGQRIRGRRSGVLMLS